MLSLGILEDPVEALAGQATTTDEEVRRVAQFLRLLRVVKMLRIIRIFKLGRHHSGLKALGRTCETSTLHSLTFCPVANCHKEMGMLSLFLFMGVLIFSSLMYTFEYDAPQQSSIKTMLDAYW